MLYRQSPSIIVYSAAVISTLIVFVYTIWVIGFRANPEYDIPISSLALITLLCIAVFSGMFLVLQKSINADIRRGWMFIILAIITKLIGESISYLFLPKPGAFFPSQFSDFFLILYFPLFFIGILSFPFKPLKRQEYLLFLLDLAIVMITLGMIFWYFILTPIINSQETGLIKIISLAFPLGDLILLGALVIINQRDIHTFPRTSLIFLVLSMILASIPDAIFSYIENVHLRMPLSNLNIFWQASVLCLIYAITNHIHSQQNIPAEMNADQERNPRIQRLLPPYISAAIGPVLLIGIIKPNAMCEPRFSGLLAGVIILICLVYARQHLVLMDNYHLYKFNRKLAIIDGLTKAYNRQYFNEIFKRLVEEAKYSGQPLSVLLIDVDGFKSFNDTYGHLTGDKVLRTIAEILAKQIRQSDILARYGGDEFVIILKDSKIEGAQKITQKIHAAIENQSIEGRPLRVSIGEAELCNGYSPEQLLDEADRNLYQQKSLKSIKR